MDNAHSASLVCPYGAPFQPLSAPLSPWHHLQEQHQLSLLQADYRCMNPCMVNKLLYDSDNLLSIYSFLMYLTPLIIH